MTKIPRPEELNPVIRENQSLRSALHVEGAAIRAEVATINARMRDTPNPGTAVANRIRAKLGQALLPDTEPDLEMIKKLRINLHDVNSAIAILDSEIEKEKVIASRLVCKAVKSEVDRLGKSFAAAFASVYFSHSEYIEFLDKVEDTGASVASLGRVWPSALGHPRDKSGAYYYGFKEFLEGGLIEKNAIPQAIR